MILGGVNQDVFGSYRGIRGDSNPMMETGAYLFMTDDIVESQQDLLKIMEFGRKVRKPLIIVAPDFKSEALTSLVVNHLK